MFMGDARVNNGGCISKRLGGAPQMALQRRLKPRCIFRLMKEYRTSQWCPRCVNKRFVER